MKNPTLKNNLAWLSGIIDGEGSIGVKCSKNKRNGNKKSYSPNIQITNCDKVLINHVVSILKTLHVNYYYSVRKMSLRNPKWKDAINIVIGTWSGVNKFLKIIIPYLVAKKRQANILLKFSEERTKIGLPQENISKKGRFCLTYIGKEEMYRKKLTKLNAKGKNNYKG